MVGAGQSNLKREQREGKNRKETGKQEEKGKRGEEDQSRQKLRGRKCWNIPKGSDVVQ